MDALVSHVRDAGDGRRNSIELVTSAASALIATRSSGQLGIKRKLRPTVRDVKCEIVVFINPVTTSYQLIGWGDAGWPRYETRLNHDFEWTLDEGRIKHV